MSVSDCDRLLEALSDRRPHHHLELYGLRMIVHSRISDLRKRGHHIRSWSESHPNGRRHYYQLVGPLAQPESSQPARHACLSSAEQESSATSEAGSGYASESDPWAAADDGSGLLEGGAVGRSPLPDSSAGEGPDPIPGQLSLEEATQSSGLIPDRSRVRFY